MDSIYTIELKSPFSDNFSTAPVPVLEISRSMKKQLLDRSIELQVADIYRGGTLNNNGSALLDSIPFYGPPSRSYLLDDYTRFPVMEEVFREYVKNVMVRKNKDKFHLYILDLENKIVYDSDPLILIDGVPVFNTDRLMALSPLKILSLIHI